MIYPYALAKTKSPILITTGLSCVICGIIGVLTIPLFTISLTMSNMIGLKGWAAGIVGGFGYIPGTILGGLLIGDGAEVRLARQTHDHVQAENGDEVDERLAEKLDVIVRGVDHGQDDSHNQHDHGQDQGSYRNLFAFHFHYPFPIRLCGA